MPDQSDTTNSASARWPYTNDLLAALLMLSFAAYTYLPLTNYTTTHAGNPVVITAYTTAFGIAVAWTFGPDAVRAWQSAKNGGGE